MRSKVDNSSPVMKIKMERNDPKEPLLDVKVLKLLNHSLKLQSFDPLTKDKIHVMLLNRIFKIPHYMKFSRHVYLVIFTCAYFTTLKFFDIAKILYFE